MVQDFWFERGEEVRNDVMSFYFLFFMLMAMHIIICIMMFLYGPYDAVVAMGARQWHSLSLFVVSK